jgi:hypothetical protein
VVTGTLTAPPGSIATLDFYASPVGDSPARPQGGDYLGSKTIAVDGSGTAVFSFTFTPIAGDPEITATATDINGTTSPFSAPVNAALIATGVSLNGSVGLEYFGTVASLAADVGAAPGDFSATIDWGDQSISPGIIVPSPGGFVVAGGHKYSAVNLATPVTVTIVDSRDSTHVTAHSVFDVLFPPLRAIAQSVRFDEGAPAERAVAAFTSTLPESFGSRFLSTIDWGDGDLSPGTVSAQGSGFQVFGTHTYLRVGTGLYTIHVAIGDPISGESTTVDSSAHVSPAPLRLQGRNFAVTGNKKFDGPVATLIDSDPRIDPNFYGVKILWNDGTVSLGKVSGQNPFTITGSHKFAAFKTVDLIWITVTDKNNRTATVVDRVVDPPGRQQLKKGLVRRPKPSAHRQHSPAARIPKYLVQKG